MLEASIVNRPSISEKAWLSADPKPFKADLQGAGLKFCTSMRNFFSRLSGFDPTGG